MGHGTFVWTDLSTFDMDEARTTYAALFGWSFSGDRAYDYAMRGAHPAAAVFPMPEKLAAMNLPSFWMSYVQADNVDATVAKARTHDGVIVEVEPQDAGDGLRIALIRDPSGAGFTVVEGMPPSQSFSGVGSVLARYHHCPDLSQIAPFYSDLFGWRFEKLTDTPWPTHNVLNPSGTVVAQVEEIPEAYRGRYRYWIPCFGADDTKKAVATVKDLGGSETGDLGDGRKLVMDSQGASFLIAPSA